MLFRRRADGTWAGVVVATDERPTKQPRFRGLRFQITVMYLGIVPPVVEWEPSASPPIQCISMLADIMHCPGKKGTDVSQVLEKQLGRIGLNCYDAVSGTGGGGGGKWWPFRNPQPFREPQPRLRAPSLPAPHCVEDR